MNEEKDLIDFEKEFIKIHKKNFSEIPKVEDKKLFLTLNSAKS